MTGNILKLVLECTVSRTPFTRYDGQRSEMRSGLYCFQENLSVENDKNVIQTTKV